jgi:hypothetical protein
MTFLGAPADAEGANWGRFVETWWIKFGGLELTTTDLSGLLTHPELDGRALGLGDGSNRSRVLRLGKALGRMGDRHVGPLRITAAGARRWRLLDTGK